MKENYMCDPIDFITTRNANFNYTSGVCVIE